MPKLSLRYAALAYFAWSTLFAWHLGKNVALGLRFEDALIVLRYARNLLEGLGFVFNPGERVLGVTTPLHTLLSTVYVGLGGEHAPALQNLAGLFFLVAEGFLVLLLLRKLGYAWLGFLAAFLVLGNFNLNYLYFGMEVHLFSALVLLSFYLFLSDREGACGLSLGLAFLTRYDAALMAALIGTWLLLEKKRFPFMLTAAFAVPVTPWILFAFFYFGSILPAPLAAKEGYYSAWDYLHRVFFYYKAAYKKLVALYFPIELLRAGLSYLFLLPVLVGAGAAATRDRRYILLGVYPFIHVSIYAMIGSDPGFSWHYYVLNPVFYLFFVIGVYEVILFILKPIKNYLPARVLRHAHPILIFAALLPLAFSSAREMSHPYRMDPHTEQLYRIAGQLRQSYGEETSLLQPAIGILGYETNFRMIDHAGLVTPGLYFFDDLNATPIEEVLKRHTPDLILLSEHSPADVEAWGYSLVRRFEGALTYRLYEHEERYERKKR